MHLVFLNQYYPPDAAPTGVMLKAVAERLVADGHGVTVLCAAGGYASGQKRKAETLKTETENLQGPDARADSSPIQNPNLRILRIGATKLGRSTFVGKLLDYTVYYIGVAWKLMTMHPRPERIVALTTPPYLSVLARVISKLRGVDHAHWVMDLYPDVMAAHGMLEEKGCVYRVLTRLARFGFGGSRCAAVLTLGPDMAERVDKVMDSARSVAPASGSQPSTPNPQLRSSSQVSSSCVQWVPLWGTEATAVTMARAIDEPIPSRDLRRERGWADDELVVMYSGNIGLGHRFGEILKVVEGGVNVEIRSDEADPLSIQNPKSKIQNLSKTRFVFYGGGKRREEIRDFIRKHPGGPVELHDYVAAEMLDAHLRSADVHLVSLDAAWTGTMVPSKLQGVFAAERPVIFIGSAGSSIGRWVSESGGGWVVDSTDVAALAAAIEEAANPQERACRGRAAKLFADLNFDRKTNVARVAEVLVGSAKA
jgi:glycosyltransferase involved in cell wall biosynthesis